ncbi:MAG: sporulation integral membrane protein YlbJ [Epulopiscium sp.]|nr:sporulation integral membrane protein YlbJ [Candidatus Epulonipiscium sp.]
MFLNKQNFKNRVLQIFILIFVINILLYAKIVISAAQKGLLLWFNTVLPSLFPFFIGTQFMIDFGLVQWIGYLFEPIMKPLFKIPGVGAFALIMGMMSGYPMGATITANLVKKGDLTSIEGQRLLSVCNQSGPLFILGVVSVGMLKQPSIGFYLLIIQYLSAFSTGLIFRFYKNSDQAKKIITTKNNKTKTGFPSLGETLKKSVTYAMELLLQIGGFIILFSVIIELLKHGPISSIFNSFFTLIDKWIPLHKELKTAFLFSILEITNGIQIISTTSAPILQKLICINGCIAWSGFSVHAQTASILQGTSLKTSIYIISKLIQSVLAIIYTFLLFPLIRKNILNSTFSVPSTILQQENVGYPIFIHSTFQFVVLCIILVILGLLYYYLLSPRNS